MTARCPDCGGDVVVIGPRAWCVKPYTLGGCGRFWADWKPRTYVEQHHNYRITYTAGGGE